ncbi:hypothetical protein NEUTE1DRAFT_83548 [Neurospora tetrasperma FGSC 2508]|uniref:Uncharacterized protein n=1 Tax=Neurospora tetrasperma (strain FGSC 2508 / ATCC MYA-4615 / P0657) TaxID=510951 RepID=F8MPU1_NEUT8|nr:uncharacterized protein NEUTE1DRAFT_83548 [Neurospora tetrasperma FGSC 2508]EGO56371.1 hypothetical protein NEUTE1DRAFT_83548 [Neurospora tetrasperma FGSC 2508]EGZ70770.1 hypothetical protein NEUTE2DRAFT_159099 [Neurospora tetrasperma FGSC 2509]
MTFIDNKNRPPLGFQGEQQGPSASTLGVFDRRDCRVPVHHFHDDQRKSDANQQQ